MKKYLYLLVLIAFFSCKNNETEDVLKTAPSQKAPSSKPVSSDLNETSTKVDVTFENEKFTKIYNAYLDVKASLVNTDNEASAASTRAFFMLLKGDETYAAIHTATIPFTEATTVKERRTIFEKVSAAVEVQIANEKIISGAVYKQYCPMAFNGKGAYWLSNSNEVRNPYFGDQMLKCGVVEKEIK
ncbi:hypothetical protein [uncultured Dokdonia sp.]|uniref:hypothetical protein n=1 Tax=uncultured Dokdonia sp. TaxID=575653 RepID=UPI0026220FBF|nr:hypothetical protein [uncultured Dokdonia sp.]